MHEPDAGPVTADLAATSDLRPAVLIGVVIDLKSNIMSGKLKKSLSSAPLYPASGEEDYATGQTFASDGGLMMNIGQGA